MAIKPDVQYPGRVQPADANYNYGSAKNETAPGAGDGTPYELARANDIFGFQQALLRAASIVPSGNAETQLVSEYMQAIVELATGRASSYNDIGIANIYTLQIKANQQGARSYFDNMKCEFIAANTNTGNTTVNVNGLGTVSILEPNSSQLLAARIVTNQRISIVYSATLSAFIIVSAGGQVATKIHLTTGATLTVPSGVTRVHIIAQGGGGGGGGGGDGGNGSGVSGGAGGNTTVNYSSGSVLLTALGGGGGGGGSSGSVPGPGGVLPESTISISGAEPKITSGNGQAGQTGEGGTNPLGRSGGSGSFGLGGSKPIANNIDNRHDGANGGGGGGGVGQDNAGGGSGASSSTIDYSFDVIPGNTLIISIGAGGLFGAGFVANFSGYGGGNGFVDVEYIF